MMFQPAFSTPTYHRFLVLWLGAIMTTGRQTITNILRTVRHHAKGHVSSYHRVLSQRRWSTWELARLLLAFLLDHVVPPGPVLLAGDDTVAERPGPHVFGKGRHRDGVRSTHSYTAYRWGHKWVVLSVLVKLPFAIRPWALPVLVALYRDPEWDQAHGTRHKTPAHIARLFSRTSSCRVLPPGSNRQQFVTIGSWPKYQQAQRHEERRDEHEHADDENRRHGVAAERDGRRVDADRREHREVLEEALQRHGAAAADAVMPDVLERRVDRHHEHAAAEADHDEHGTRGRRAVDERKHHDRDAHRIGRESRAAQVLDRNQPRHEQRAGHDA